MDGAPGSPPPTPCMSMLPPGVKTCWVNCVIPGCNYRVKVFGERERGLPCTFYKKPTSYHKDLDPRLRPSAVTKRQRAHLVIHKKHAIAGSREHRHVVQALKRLDSKRFRAKGSTPHKVQLSRKARQKARRRASYHKVTRVLHLTEEKQSWEVRAK